VLPSDTNYIINNCVALLPKIWKPGLSERQGNKDKRVFDIFKSAYPDRRIVQIDPLILNHLGRGMDYLAQTQPRITEQLYFDLTEIR
jgi:hypothetical protein